MRSRTSAPPGQRRSRAAYLIDVSRAAWLREKRRERAHMRVVLPRLAELVASLVPRGAVVADVGGGDGAFSLLLREAGLRPLLIDPRYAEAGAVPPAGIKVVPRRLSHRDVAWVALLVGVHPCNATPFLTRIRQKPVVIIPCCHWYWWIRGRWQDRAAAEVLLSRRGRIRAGALVSWP